MTRRKSVAEQLAAHPRNRRLRSKNELAHKPSGVGKGRWHSRTALWKARGKMRRKRAMSNASRRQNRGL